MKKLMVAMICVVLVVALGLVVFMGVVINNGGWPTGGDGGNMFAKLNNRQVFNADDFDTIELAYSSDSITLYPSQNGEVVLEEYSSRQEEARAARIAENGRQLSIQEGERPLFTFGIYISYVHLYLPAEWLGALMLETHSGSIKAESDFHLDSLVAAASSGSVRFGNMTVRQGIRLAASSGSIHCGALAAENDIELEASSGGIHFGTLATNGAVRAETHSGSISGDGISAGGNVALGATSGGIHIGEVAGKDVTASSSSGSLRFDTVNADTFSGNATSGGIRVGMMNAQFRIESSSGSVEIEDGTGGGKMHTTSGSVRLTLSLVTGDLALSSGSGGVRLVLPADSSLDFTAHTGSGSIHTPFDDSLRYNKDGNEANGQYGEGPTYYQVNCKTSSGSVRVEWK